MILVMKQHSQTHPLKQFQGTKSVKTCLVNFIRYYFHFINFFIGCNNNSTTVSVGKFDANLSCQSFTTYLFFHLQIWTLQLDPILCYQDPPEIILIVVTKLKFNQRVFRRTLLLTLSCYKIQINMFVNNILITNTFNLSKLQIFNNSQ